MRIIKIAQQVRLKDLCQIRTNFPDADFWLQRKGSKETVGTPTKEFYKEHIGIKVERTDILDANYLYYMFMGIHSKGEFRNNAFGTTNLVNIRTEYIQNIPIG